MTVLPAFFRHLYREKSTAVSKSKNETWRGGLSGTAFGYRKTERDKDPNDSYLLSSDYRELNDVENQSAPDTKGTTTMIDGGCSDISMPEQAIEDLHGNPATNALVSNSVHVQSIPLDAMEDGHRVPQDVHFKN